MSLSRLFLGSLLLLAVFGCSNESPKIIPSARVIPDNVVEKPDDFQAFNPKVDILFVIDNSGSMGGVQSDLRRNAYLFADAMSRVSILDYHIGVVSTDMDSWGGGPRNGALYGFPAYLEKTTPNFVALLSERMVLGTNGSATEMMFSPVQAALSPPMETTQNAGFLRSDAFLAVIFITDADDQSHSVNASQLLQFLTQKKGSADLVLGYGVIRTLAQEKLCSGSERIEGKLEDFLAMVSNGDIQQKNIFSLCDPDYGARLVELANDIVKRVSSEVKLKRVPVVETIKVFYGNQEIPNDPYYGWTYRPSTNTLVLGAGIEWEDQGPGVTLSIDFEAIDFSQR